MFTLLQHDNIPEWIVNKEILLNTASITKYKEGTKELRLLTTHCHHCNY